MIAQGIGDDQQDKNDCDHGQNERSAHQVNHDEEQEGERDIEDERCAVHEEKVAEGGAGHDTIAGTAWSDRIDLSQTTLSGIEAIDGGAGHDAITGSAGDDVITGGQGRDTLDGGAGDDTLIGGSENDIMAGGAGNDLFVFQAASGHDRVDGGTGAQWTDAIQLEDAAPASDGQAGWTIEFDSGGIENATDAYLALSSDTSGTITFEDGNTIAFQGIERIEW